MFSHGNQSFPDVSLENIAPISIADEALMGRPGVGGEVDLSGSGEEQRICIRGPGLSEKGVEVASRARFSSVVINGESTSWLLGQEAELNGAAPARRRGGGRFGLAHLSLGL